MKRVDINLVGLDFAEAHDRDPRQAVALALALLLDARACRARVAFLEAVAGWPRSPGDFSSEVRLLAEVGLARALRERRLSCERLDALLRDPTALWQAHTALVGEEPVFSVCSIGEPLGGFTDMLSTGRWPALEERLRPYLPAVLRFVGLEREPAEGVLAYVLQRAREDTTGKRFRDLLPAWLEDYARFRGLDGLPRPLRIDDWLALIEEGAVQLVLAREEPTEPDWAQQFRRGALAQRVGSWPEVELLAPPEQAGSAFAVFRRNLLVQIQRERDKAVALFELN
jgi:hypothetical protein